MDAHEPLDGILLDDLVDEVLGYPAIIGCCWGMELSGEVCTPDFQPGSNHFKNKFCTACKEFGFAVPAERVRAARPSLMLSNTNSRSAWTQGARIVNQTRKCVGPRLVIFRERVGTEPAGCELVPENWLRRGAGAPHVHFSIKLGTAVPMPAPVIEAATKRAREEEEEEDGGGVAEVSPCVALVPLAANGDALPVLDTSACLNVASVSHDDVLALSSAISAAQFQRLLKDRLGVCAAAFCSLSGGSERSCMHHMFREAMERQLVASVGDACLARVLQAFERDGVLPGCDAAHVQVPFVCALFDEGVWAYAVEQIAMSRAASAPTALIDTPRAPAMPTHAPPGDLAQLRESFTLLRVDSGEGCCQLKDSDAAVQRTTELLKRQLEETHTPWKAVSMEGLPTPACDVRTHYADGLLYCLTQVELHASNDDAQDAAASGGLGARATEVLHRALEMCCTRCERRRHAHGDRRRTHDYLWRVDPLGDGLSGRMLRLLWGSHCLELEREERGDGTRVIFVEWDVERDEAAIVDAERQLANVSVASLHFDASKCAWRLSCIEAYMAPTFATRSHVLSMSDSLNGMVVDLCKTVCGYFIWMETKLIVQCVGRALMDSRASLQLLAPVDPDQGRQGAHVA